MRSNMLEITIIGLVWQNVGVWYVASQVSEWFWIWPVPLGSLVSETWPQEWSVVANVVNHSQNYYYWSCFTKSWSLICRKPRFKTVLVCLVSLGNLVPSTCTQAIRSGQCGQKSTKLISLVLFYKILLNQEWPEVANEVKFLILG